jgi:hypothetical protein
MRESTKAVLEGLEAKGYEACYASGKGGGFFVKGKGWVSMGTARRLADVPAPKRVTRPLTQPWGDWATVAMLNGYRVRKGG